jgi:Sulfotransferase family
VSTASVSSRAVDRLRGVKTWPVVGPASLHARSAARQLGRQASLRAAVAPLEDRLVFVLGSPRSGTTFLAGAIGSLPGFVDLGEVPPLKAAIPLLASLPPDQAASRLRRLLWPTRRLGGVAGLRGVEQTPESAFIGEAILRAYPRAVLIHLVRDGRDVVCSLLERGWLSPSRAGRDDAGATFGVTARFWVEPEREPEFAQAGDARRCAWAWRRYVAAARSLGDAVHELRYEQLCTDPDAFAGGLAAALAVPAEMVRPVLTSARPESVGRFRSDLTSEQLKDVEAEAGVLLGELGYL